MVKAYTDTFVTLQISDQNHLINSFLTPASEECEGTGIAMGGFELDVERMFPSIPRERVMRAWEGLATRYATLGNTKRVGGTTIWVSIDKGGNRKLCREEVREGLLGLRCGGDTRNTTFRPPHERPIYYGGRHRPPSDGRGYWGVSELGPRGRYTHAC